jgi:hypothetical protein
MIKIDKDEYRRYKREERLEISEKDDPYENQWNREKQVRHDTINKSKPPIAITGHQPRHIPGCNQHGVNDGQNVEFR